MLPASAPTLAASATTNFDSMIRMRQTSVMADHVSADDELEIPQTGSRWMFVFYALFFPFFIGTNWIAVWNLRHFSERSTFALFASGVWLLLSGFACYGLGYFEPGGIRTCYVCWQGQFGSRQLAWIERREGEVPMVCFGYELWGRRFRYLSVQANRIRSVECSLGQASSMTGTDMNDWHVCVWFRAEHQSPRSSGIERNGEWLSLHIVGTQGPKQAIAEFGLAVVSFMERAGVVIAPAGDVVAVIPLMGGAKVVPWSSDPLEPHS